MLLPNLTLNLWITGVVSHIGADDRRVNNDSVSTGAGHWGHCRILIFHSCFQPCLHADMILTEEWSAAVAILNCIVWTCLCACHSCDSGFLLCRFQEAKFLIGRQKYPELLEVGKTTIALQVLRNELAPLNVDQDQLHFLSRYAFYTYAT